MGAIKQLENTISKLQATVTNINAIADLLETDTIDKKMAIRSLREIVKSLNE